MLSYLTEKVFTIDIGPNIIMGLDEGNGVILFDTGLDESVAKKIDKSIGKPVSTIINSHSHADHIGGNHYFQKKYNSKVYVANQEISFVTNPELEPSLLNGGFWEAIKKDKFLSAKPSKAEPLDHNFLKSKGIEVIELSGHSPSLTGFKIDSIIYLSDAVFSTEIIEKYKVLYLYDVSRFIISLTKIEETPFEIGVICHKGIFTKEELKTIIEVNRNHTSLIKNMLIESANNSSDYEITKYLMDKLNIDPTLTIYLLILSTIRGYLSTLQNEGVLEPIFDKGVLWKKR